MTDVDDNNDTSPDGGEERFSDGVPTVPETRDDEATPLMDASTVAMDRTVDENAPFPQINGYEIIEAMQAGGQGKLYKARELTPAGREVVLKFPRAGVLSSDRAVALFENEVQKAASLDHPNIARIYSSGLYDRMPFYSMEFIDGVDLGEHVKQADLGQREILELMRTICLAVQHAHQRQIVHRDLKPANIMVTTDGAVPKLLDFGLAIEETELQATIDRGVGTLVYMSPEQAAYEPVTTQTDVYSLGVILYELLTGQHPHGFTQQDWRTLTPGQFRDRVANGEVIRPRRVSDRIDKELEALLLKALAHESSDRYASAGDMAADINNYLTGEPLTAKAPTTMYFLRKRLRKYRVRVAIATVVLAALIGIAVFAYVSVTWERDRADRAAKSAKLEADNARIAEKDATKQRDIARKETTRAKKAEKAAIEAKQAESQQRRRAETEVYRYGISEADRLSRAGMYTDARELLNTLEPSVRGWEYGHLMCRSVRRDFEQLLTLKGHSSEVGSVAFSPDGKRLASGSTDKTIKIWDTVTGKELLTLKGHSKGVDSVAFSPDGKRLASASGDKTIKLWDTVTGKELLTLKGHSGFASSIAFSPDGKRLASPSVRTIKIWDAVTGKELLTLKGHSRGVLSIAFSPDGKRLASASHTIKLWDTLTGKELLTLKGHSGIERAVLSVTFSPDGKRLASGGLDRTIKLWETAAGKELLTLRGHSGEVFSVVFSLDGSLVSGSADGTIKRWDVVTGKELLTLRGRPEGVWSVAFSPDGKRLASGNHDTTIKLWDTVTKTEVVTFKGHSRGVWSVAFSPDGKCLASGSNKTIKLWDTVTGETLLTLERYSEEVDSVAFSPDGKRVASGRNDKTIKLWDTVTGKELLTLKGHSDRVPSVAFSPDGKRLVSGSRDKTIKLWDTATGKEVLTLKGHSHAVFFVAFLPDGKRLASVSHDTTIKLWDTVTGNELLTLKGHSTRRGSIAFSPDGKRLALGSQDYAIKLLDTATGQELLTLKGHSHTVQSLAFSPDGRRLASGSWDQTIKLWDTVTGNELLTLKGHSHAVKSLAFSPDGKRLASGGQDKTIKFWNTLDWTKSPILAVERKLKAAGTAKSAKPRPVEVLPSSKPRPVQVSPSSKPRYYIIKKVDTLWTVAKKTLGNGGRWKDIIKANPGLDPKNLRIGQKIIIPSAHIAEHTRITMLKGLLDNPGPEKLNDVVIYWASEAVNGPNEKLFRHAVAKLGVGKWQDVLLNSLNAKKFAARGSALAVLAARGAEIDLLKSVKLMTAKTVSVQAMQTFAEKFGYIPANGGELLACVILQAGGKDSLDAPARLARQWGKKYKYKFNIRDFHLLSLLAIDPLRRKIGRDELVKQIVAKLRGRRHIAAGGGPFSKQTARMTLPDLWNIVLLDEMLRRQRVTLSLRMLADRLRAGGLSPCSGLVFYEGGKASAKLYPQRADSTSGDRDHIPERELQRAGFSALCHLHTRFEKVNNEDLAPASKLEVSASNQGNFYGLVLASIDTGTFSAFYYNPDGAVVSLGLFAFGK